MTSRSEQLNRAHWVANRGTNHYFIDDALSWRHLKALSNEKIVPLISKTARYNSF